MPVCMYLYVNLPFAGLSRYYTRPLYLEMVNARNNTTGLLLIAMSKIRDEPKTGFDRTKKKNLRIEVSSEFNCIISNVIMYLDYVR